MPEGRRLTDAAQTSDEPRRFMQRVADEAVHLVPAAEGVGICLAGSDGWLEFVAMAGCLVGFEGFRVAPGQTLHALALATGRIQQTDDALADPRVHHESALSMGIGSMIVLPVARNARPFGAVTVMSSAIRAFDVADVELLESLAGFLSLTVSAVAESSTANPGSLRADPASDPGNSRSQTAIAQFISQVVAPTAAIDADMVERISRAILHRSFRSVVQPIVNMNDGVTVGAEALTRFDDPLPPPGDWFEAARQVGLASDLEYATANLALEMLDHLPRNLYLSVNFGPGLLANLSLDSLLATHDLSRLVIELTEHVIVADYDQLAESLEPLRSAGARLAIDDAGAGFASLSHILKLAPDIIKLDRSLVEGIDSDGSRRILTTSLARLGTETGATVIAEGVETEPEASTLISLGVTYGQGYLFAHPGPIHSLPLRVTRPARAPTNVRPFRRHLDRDREAEL